MAANKSAIHVLVVCDPEEEFLQMAERALKADDVEVVTTRSSEQALEVFLQREGALLLCNAEAEPVEGLKVLRRVRLERPQAVVVLCANFPRSGAVIEAMSMGAFDYVRKGSLAIAQELRQLVERALNVLDSRAADPEEGVGAEADDVMIARSEPMQEVVKLIGRVSRSHAPVLITGESGSGKEVVARAIHRHGPRAEREFVAINCAAIPEALLESELFGHEKGAFTGAHARRLGRFEQCDEGTLFLDEIGDMPMQVQAKLLRVLQEGQFSRVGGNETLETNVRILAATHHDMELAIEQGRFRQDLFYRLNVVRLHLPPLRQRVEDVRPLAEFFLGRLQTRHGLAPVTISREGLQALEAYHWPGNVRELENTLHRAAVLASREVLLPADLPLGEMVAGAGQQPEVERLGRLLLRALAEGGSDDVLADGVELLKGLQKRA